MRVLVIDDEPDVLMLCRVNLELAGHEVIEASNGEAGLELALREQPDVVVLDVMLLKMDGSPSSDARERGQTRDVPDLSRRRPSSRIARRAGGRDAPST
jgi:DNA-binding response OmpR family regulator